MNPLRRRHRALAVAALHSPRLGATLRPMQPLRLMWIITLVVAFLDATDGPAWAHEPSDPVGQRTESNAGVWLDVPGIDDEVLQRKLVTGAAKARAWSRMAFGRGPMAELRLAASNKLRPSRHGNLAATARDARLATRQVRAGARLLRMTSDDPFGHLVPLSV